MSKQMTVLDLIEELSKLDPDMPVFTAKTGYAGWYESKLPYLRERDLTRYRGGAAVHTHKKENDPDEVEWTGKGLVIS